MAAPVPADVSLELIAVKMVSASDQSAPKPEKHFVCLTKDVKTASDTAEKRRWMPALQSISYCYKCLEVSPSKPVN